MYLGAKSLTNPLFTPPTGSVTCGDGKHHFTTSDYDMIWAEEGCSNSGLDIQGVAPKEVRYVRYLGMTAAERKKSPRINI